ncbi:MAG: hypothetical protein HC850_17670 [Rhodomicrobium sp.]|nr:hypothetical protein [Rhodomicrobium sp.]
MIYAVLCYFVAGLLIAAAFVALGLPRVLAQPRPISIGAKLIFMPGAAILWPYVLFRWIAAARAS